VGDVVVLRCNGDISAHFVDNVGFVELSSFTGNEKEPSLSQVGKSSALSTLEADVKAGKSISVLELARAVKQPTAEKGKPSILSELAEAQKLAAQGGKQNHKTNDRGYE
jgi:hypothetical protein